MNNFRKLIMSASLNFRKWRGDWRIVAVLVGVLCFNSGNLAGMNRLCADYGVKTTPWLFPLMYNMPIMLTVYGYFTIVFFSDAPFMDGQTIFWIARTGRLNWIFGQMIYIVAASLILALFLGLSPVLAVLPNATFDNDWGDAVYLLIDEHHAGYNVTIMASEMLTDFISPARAMLISVGMSWLIGAFVGGLMMCLNYLFGAYAGTLACGFLTFMSYFACYAGEMFIGSIIHYLTPMRWASVMWLDWSGTTYMPSPVYGIAVLTIGVILTFSISAITFCRRDVAIKQGGILQ